MLDELDSYTLSDFLLFSQETYFRLFELYNQALWPLHLVAFACGGAALFCLLRGYARIAWGILALLWALVAWAFHLERYATINLAAPYFAMLFGFESILLLLMALTGGRRRADTPPVDARADGRRRAAPVVRHRAGAAILAYAMLLHPFTEILAGRTWTAVSTFGMAPDPTAIGTLGALLFAGGRRRWVLLLPALTWCAVSALTASALGSVEAVAPAAFATVALVFSAAPLKGRIFDRSAQNQGARG